MVYRNHRNAYGFLLAGAILFPLSYFAQWDAHDPEEAEGGLAFVVLGILACLIAINGFLSRIEINAEGLRRRNWFGFVSSRFSWTSLLSWKVAQVPQHVEESAGTWFVEFELAGPDGPHWFWIYEGQVGSPEFFKLVEDVRAYVGPKERIQVPIIIS